MDLDLKVGPSQIEDGNVAPLLSLFLQFLGTNVCIGCIHVYQVILFSLVHDYSLIFLHYCHQWNQSLRWPQLLLGIRHKVAVCDLEMHFIFVSAPDMLWNWLLGYFIFQWCGHLATHPLPCCGPSVPVLIKSLH